MTITKRISLGIKDKYPHFIGSWIIETDICDSIVKHFEEHTEKHTQGVMGSGLNLQKKNRKDISFSPKEINLPGNNAFRKYFESLFQCYQDYNKQWPFLEKNIERLDIGRFNIGRYQAGQHFQDVHCERCSMGSMHRVFAFMTYLNDVDEGGSTYFNHYDIDIKPIKGLSLIWPAEWTHAHKGNIIKKGNKYIITGWLDFVE